MKPLHGNGGAAVFKVARKDPNFGSLFDLFAATFREPWVVQRFLPEVVKGDKRIILVDGVAAGAVNRVPAENDIRSNMVRGGAARRDRPHAARAGDLRAHRSGAARARPDLRRHRRDRRLPDRDQRHLADGPPGHQAARRPGPRAGDLGRDRGPQGPADCRLRPRCGPTPVPERTGPQRPRDPGGRDFPTACAPAHSRPAGGL